MRSSAVVCPNILRDMLANYTTQWRLAMRVPVRVRLWQSRAWLQPTSCNDGSIMQETFYVNDRSTGVLTVTGAWCELVWWARRRSALTGVPCNA